jgi:hypothetical protein
MYARPHVDNTHNGSVRPALHDILQFNLDFGAGSYSNTIAVEIAFLVAACPYIHASCDLLAEQGCTNRCTSSRNQKNSLKTLNTHYYFFQQITTSNTLRPSKLLSLLKQPADFSKLFKIHVYR